MCDFAKISVRQKKKTDFSARDEKKIALPKKKRPGDNKNVF